MPLVTEESYNVYAEMKGDPLPFNSAVVGDSLRDRKDADLDGAYGNGHKTSDASMDRSDKDDGKSAESNNGNPVNAPSNKKPPDDDELSVAEAIKAAGVEKGPFAFKRRGKMNVPLTQAYLKRGGHIVREDPTELEVAAERLALAGGNIRKFWKACTRMAHV
jgi:hypothetical protein